MSGDSKIITPGGDVARHCVVSHRRPSKVVGATDSSFRQSPPEKSDPTAASLHELHYLSSPGSEKQTENQFWFHEIRELHTVTRSSITQLVLSIFSSNVTAVWISFRHSCPGC